MNNLKRLDFAEMSLQQWHDPSPIIWPLNVNCLYNMRVFIAYVVIEEHLMSVRASLRREKEDLAAI
jgi:hypothetical protein